VISTGAATERASAAALLLRLGHRYQRAPATGSGARKAMPQAGFPVGSARTLSLSSSTSRIRRVVARTLAMGVAMATISSQVSHMLSRTGLRFARKRYAVTATQELAMVPT
jgi:hypothetical protein